MFSFLPYEIYAHIAEVSDENTQYSLLRLCKNVNYAIKFYGHPSGVLGSYRLSREQRDILSQLQYKTEEKVIALRAPPSTGKTVITLSFILWEGGCNLIIVPPSLLENWFNEIKKSFPSFYSLDATKSKTLVYHSSYKSHYSYIKENRNISHISLILTTTLLSKKLYDLSYNRIVIDEAHQWRKRINSWENKRFLSLSSSMVHKPHFIHDYTNHCDISIPNRIVNHVVPSIKRFFIEERQYLSCLAHYDKILILVPTMKQYKEVSKNHKHFFHKQNGKCIEAFHLHSGKAILFSTYSKLSLGHNINAHTTFFLKARSSISTNAFLQPERRLCRITNNEREVYVYYVGRNNLIDKMYLRYTCIHSLLIVNPRDWDYYTEKAKGWHRILRGDISLAFREIHICFEDLTDYEFLYYCHVNVDKGLLYNLFYNENIINDQMRANILPYYK